MNKYKYFALFLLLPFWATLSAQTDVQRITATAFTDAQGFVYKLPKTKLIIEVKAGRTVSKAGPFYLYAERYLGVTNAITQDSDIWTLQSVTVRTQGVPNNDKIFKITDVANSTMLLQLTTDGIIAAINQQVEEQPFEIINTPAPVLDLKFNMAALGQDALLAGSTAKMAEIASRQIYSIRENRTDILTGETDNIPAGEAMKVLFAEMDKNERDLLELFIGKTASGTMTRSFELTPDKDLNNEVLFRFSQSRGFADKDDFGAAPVYINLKGDRKTMDATIKPTKKKSGIVYSIPGTAVVKIIFGGQTMYNGEFQIGQFGVEQSLAPNLFNKNATNSLIFDTRTGAMTQTLK